MKKKIIMFLLLLLSPCFVFALENEDDVSSIVNENKVVNVVNEITENSEDLMYKALKLDDGYIILNSGYNYRTEYITIYLKKIDKKNNEIWSKSYSYYTGFSYHYTEHVDVYLVNDKEFIFTMREGTALVSLDTGEIIKEDTSIRCYDLIEYGDDLLCVGDAFFDGDYIKTNNNLYIIDKELNIISTLNFNDYSEGLIAVTVENDNIYVLGYNSESYYIKTLDESLAVVNTLTLDDGLDEMSFMGSGSIAFEKVGDDFYFVCHELYKIDSNGVATHFAGVLGGYYGGTFGIDYTSIKKVNDYVVLTGLNLNAEDNINALIEIYDSNFELKQAIDVNSYFGVDSPLFYSGSGMAITKGITLTENGFVASGILNNYTSFLIEYELFYNITSTTDNNGEIEVVSQALSGDMITFNVRAKNGYKLSTLSVTNSLLETITFTEDELILNEDGTFSLSRNSFKMPSSDVEINATFEKIPDNPNTIDNIVFYTGMFVVSLGLIIGIVLYKKKHL